MGKFKKYKIKEKKSYDIGNKIMPDPKKSDLPTKINKSVEESSSASTFKKFVSRIPILKSKLKLKTTPQKSEDMTSNSFKKEEKEIQISKTSPSVPVAQIEELVQQNISPLLVFNADTNEVECLIAKEPEQENYISPNSLIFKFNSLAITAEKIEDEIKKEHHLTKPFKARRSSYTKKFHRKLSKSLEKFKYTLNRKLSCEKIHKLSVSALKEILEENISLCDQKSLISEISDVPDSDIGTLSEQIETPRAISTTTSETQTDSGWNSTEEDVNIIRHLPKPKKIDIFDDLDYSLSPQATNFIPQKNKSKQKPIKEQTYDLLVIETPENLSTENLLSEEELKDIASRNSKETAELEEHSSGVLKHKGEDILKCETKRKVSFDTSTLIGERLKSLKPTAPEFIPDFSRPSTSSSYLESSSRPSTSGSGCYSTPPSTSSSESADKRSFTYSIENEDKLLNIKTIISKLAFQNIPPCQSEIRPDLIRQKPMKVINLQNNEASEENASFDDDDDDSNVDIIEFEGRTIKINRPPEPKLHAVTMQSPNIAQTIDRLENMLEMLLMMGFNITRGVKDKFKPQEVPMPIHTAMTEVRGFLKPIKQKLKLAVECGDGVFFQPFADCVNASINPAYHQLNDAIVALESPITENYRQLQSIPVYGTQSYEEQNIISTLSDFAPVPKTAFMNQSMGKMYKGIPGMPMPTSGARVNPVGLIELPFRYDLRVVLTADLGIMVFSRTGRVHIALSANEKVAGLHFRYGQVYQAKKCINFNCMDEMNQVSKIARITEEGVIFQDECSPSTYMTTPGGTITCSRIANSILPSFISEIFYSGSRFGKHHVKDCVEILRYSRFDFEEDGSLSWIIQNIKIKQTPDGQLVVHKKNATFTMVITPRVGPEDEDFTVSSRLTTPRVHATSSLTMKDEGNIFHMYGKCQSRKVFYSNEKFVVRCQTQTAGIDEHHAIRLHMS